MRIVQQGIDSLLELIKGCRLCFKDFIEIGVLLYPVGKSPCNEAQIPVSFNLLNVPYLVVVKVKGVL